VESGVGQQAIRGGFGDVSIRRQAGGGGGGRKTCQEFETLKLLPGAKSCKD